MTENKKVKSRKAPGIFKKPVKKKVWKKKFLEKVYLPEDKKFLEALVVEEGGFVSLDVSSLDAKEYKKLKMLAKTIRTNRKSLNFIIVFIIVIIAAGGVFFHVYLKNKLVQQLVENSLQKIFLARVETEGVNLSVLKGEFSLDYLAIADSASPMRNIAEFSGVKADMDTAELLQGRIFIRELGFKGLKRGTERLESGFLPVENTAGDEAAASGNAASGEGNAAGEDGKPYFSGTGKDAVADVVGQISTLVGNIDVEEILEQQKNNLESFTLIEDSGSRMKEYSDQWETRIGEWSRKVDEWDSSVKYIASVNADSFNSVAGAQSAIDRLQGIYREAESDYQSIQNDYAAAQRQYQDASGMMDQIKTAVENDYKYIESLVSLPTGGKVDWAATVIEEQMSVPLKKYLSYFDRGIQWYERFKKLAEIKEKSAPEKRRDGRSLPPRVDAPPGFVLAHAFASGNEPGLAYRFDLNNIVSEPEKRESEASLEIELEADSTGKAEAVITENDLMLSVPAVPFDLADALAGLDIEYFTGLISMESAVSRNDSGFDGSIDLKAGELVLKPRKDGSILFRMINSAVESVKPVSAEGLLAWSEAGGLDLSFETNLDDGLGNAASALVSEGAEEGVKLLREYLGEQLEEPMAQLDSIRTGFDSRVEQIKSYQDDMDSYRRQAENKIAEIRSSVENSARKEAGAIIKQAIPEGADKQLEDAADALKKGLGGALKF